MSEQLQQAIADLLSKFGITFDKSVKTSTVLVLCGG